MKKQILLSCIAIIFSLSFCKGQIEEGDKSMSQGVYNALSIELPNVKERTVEKMWKKYIKEYGGKTKRIRKKDEYFTNDAEIVAIGGSNTVDVYARVAEAGDDVYLTVWFDLGGSFLSSTEHPVQYPEAEKILMRFAIDVAKKLTQEELDDELKNLKKLERVLSKLKRANNGYHRDIEKAKERIIKAESKIQTNDQEQIDAVENIEEQKAIVKEIQKRLNDL